MKNSKYLITQCIFILQVQWPQLQIRHIDDLKSKRNQDEFMSHTVPQLDHHSAETYDKVTSSDNKVKGQSSWVSATEHGE